MGTVKPDHINRLERELFNGFPRGSILISRTTKGMVDDLTYVSSTKIRNQVTGKYYAISQYRLIG